MLQVLLKPNLTMIEVLTGVWIDTKYEDLVHTMSTTVRTQDVGTALGFSSCQSSYDDFEGKGEQV